MVTFNVENQDELGREGVLEIEEHEINTPYYIPTSNEFNHLNGCPFVNDNDYRDIEVGECVYWLDLEKLTRMARPDIYFNIRRTLRAKLENMGTEIKLLHFEFYSEVSTLNVLQLERLLNLQNEAGASVIEIPNAFRHYWNYDNMMDRANQWKTNNNIEKSLIGLACDLEDITLLASRSSKVEGFGINLRQDPILRLYRSEEQLSPLDKWIHTYSTPRTYKQVVNSNGTFGILINRFGIDTLSSPVLNPKSIRNYIVTRDDLAEEVREEEANNLKYFSPLDYSTQTYNHLISQHDEEYRLANLCGCPVCRDNTLSSMALDYELANCNTRSHEVLAHYNEANNFRNSIRNNETREYLESKEFARQLLERQR